MSICWNSNCVIFPIYKTLEETPCAACQPCGSHGNAEGSAHAITIKITTNSEAPKVVWGEWKSRFV